MVAIGGARPSRAREREPEALISLQMGWVAGGAALKSGTPTLRRSTLPRDVRANFEWCASVDRRRARRMLGLAGTVTALAALRLGLDHYDANRTHHSLLSRAQVEASFELLCASNLEARRKLLAEPQRAEVIVGGAAVLVTMLREFAISELLVSVYDILDGRARRSDLAVPVLRPPHTTT